MSKDGSIGFENPAARQVAKNTGLLEVAKTAEGSGRALIFKSTREWLAQQETHFSPTSTNDISRIDFTLNYLAQINGNLQLSEIVSKQPAELQTIIRERVNNSKDLVADLVAIPQDGSDLSGAICQARVLNEIQRITSIPGANGKKTTQQEAIAQMYSETVKSRGKILEQRINQTVRVVVDPSKFITTDIETWSEFMVAQASITQQAERELAQLQIYQYATHYELTQPREAGKQARERAFQKAWQQNLDNPKVPGRANRIASLYHHATKLNPANAVSLENSLREHKINFTSPPKTEHSASPTSPTSIIVEVGIPVLPPEPVKSLIIPEDISSLERANKDKEHIHWHPRAILITDSHGLGKAGLTRRLHEEFGASAKVEIKSGLAYVNGEEVPIYHGGDALDLNKAQVENFMAGARGFKSKSEYLLALSDDKHKDHAKAVKIQQTYIKLPQMLDKSFTDIEKAFQDYNIEEAVEIHEAIVNKRRGLLGNHEAMMLSGWEGSNTQLLLWVCRANLGETTFNSITGTKFGDVLKEFNLEGLTEVAVDTLAEPLRTNLCNRLRQVLKNSAKAVRVKENIQKNVKLYNVVNGEVQLHSSIAIDKTGKLVPFKSLVDANRSKYTEKSHVDFFNQIDKLTGFEAMDYWESQIHLGNRAAIDFAAYSNDDLFGRTEFHENMLMNGEYIMEQLTEQAKKKGFPGKLKHLIIGHTPAVGGKMLGDNLLCADDDNATPVRIDLVNENGNLVSNISTSHQFSQTQPIKNQIK